MTTVYLVMSNDGSGNAVEAVYEDKLDAKEACAEAQVNDKWYNYYVVEWEVQ